MVVPEWYSTGLEPKLSNKFVIEMPRPKMRPTDAVMLCCGGMVMSVSALTLASIFTTTDMPSWILALLVVFTLAAATMIFRFIRREIKRHRAQMAEKFINSGIERLGYVALEPIGINGNHGRMLLKDAYGPALWSISISGRRILCLKIPAMVLHSSDIL